ncbi:MAG: response regulator transcription factor [Clostridia bacterium]|nr:response regulator transcription factor [Clostridia bacterium]
MRVLLVEDEVALAEAVAASLKKENYTVDVSYDGLDGLDQGLTGIYDVILLDIMLPKMNGVEVLRELRREKIITPVIMLTAKSTIDDKLNSFETGADDYITKPFHTKELIARIRAVSRRKGEIEDAVIKFGDLALDTKLCEISCIETGQSMKLSAKEFQMLEYMLKNKRQVITKEQFIEKVWGFESDAEYNSVEVYISFIRKKMSFIGCTTKIKAVRGIGYVLEEQKDD